MNAKLLQDLADEIKVDYEFYKIDVEGSGNEFISLSFGYKSYNIVRYWLSS